MKVETSKAVNRAPDFQSIACIIVYFGKVPWYFRFFTKSCSYNPDIDFILITNLEVTEELANNIIVVKSSLDEVTNRFKEKLGFKVNIAQPYKLCDVRPAYGVVFSDVIEGYDFWGYCDIDLIFGDIRSLITPDILYRHEVISASKTYMAGFFALYRNSEKVNNLFRRSKDYQKVFQQPVYYGFDECNLDWGYLNRGKNIFELNREIDSITHVVKMAELAGDLTVFWRAMEGRPGNMVWDRGELLRNKNEKALLCHFIEFKKKVFKYIPQWKTVPDRFYIHASHFSKYRPGSLADKISRILLTSAKIVKISWNMLTLYSNAALSYPRWFVNFIISSKKLTVKHIQHVDGLTGNYKLNNGDKLTFGILMKNRRLHVSIDGTQFLLLHKGATKFVLSKCRFHKLINVELNFRYNKFASANELQVTATGHVKWTFFKVS
jgi:hypothetical protein